MLGFLDTLTTSEQLDARHVDRVDSGAVICEKSSKGSSINLRAVDDSDGFAEKAVSRCENGVVDLEILKNLHDGERCARQDRLETVVRRV